MIIFQGLSQIDNEPIVAILTGFNSKTRNRKTGKIPQVWILRSDMHPIDALRLGADYSICGGCIHRPIELGDNALRKWSRTCYVNVMSLNSIYKAYSKNKYRHANLSELAEQLSGRKVRIGAYGDPASVPIEVWDTLLAHCQSTGYTHQWKTCDERYSQYCMASCDNQIEVIQSIAKGYRTFFVQNVVQLDKATRKVQGVKLAWCPASNELGKKTTCESCMACTGNRTGLKSNISILMH